MKFSKWTFDYFESISGIDVKQFFIDYERFVSTDLDRIISFFSGESELYSESFKNLELLIKKSKQIKQVFIDQQSNFSSFDFWNLLDSVEEIDLKLLTFTKTSKFLRSSIKDVSYNRSVENTYTLKQGQTLERVSENTLNSTNFLNDWADIAQRNNLTEEGYTTQGGILLSVVFDKIGGIANVDSVVDNIVGEKIYGIDVKRVIEFYDNDLAVLSYKETIEQIIDILCNLRKNDNPEFPEDGIVTSFVVGTNYGSLAFPSIVRQLFNTFATDDTISSFSLTNVKQEKDSLTLEAQIGTRIGEFIDKKIQL